MADEDDWGDHRMSSVEPAPRKRIHREERRVREGRQEAAGNQIAEVRHSRRVASRGQQTVARFKKPRTGWQIEGEWQYPEQEEVNQEEKKPIVIDMEKVKAHRQRSKSKLTMVDRPHTATPRRVGTYGRTEPREQGSGVWGDDTYPVWGTPEKARSKPQVKQKPKGKTKTQPKAQNRTTTRAGGKNKAFESRAAANKSVGVKKPATKKPSTTKKTVSKGQVVGVVANGKGAQGVKVEGKKTVVVTGPFKGKEAAAVLKTSKKLQAQKKERKKQRKKQDAKLAVSSKPKLEEQRQKKAAEKAEAKQKRAQAPKRKVDNQRDARGRFVAPSGKKKPKPKVLSERTMSDREFYTKQRERLDNGEISRETYERYNRARKAQYRATKPVESDYSFVLRYKEPDSFDSGWIYVGIAGEKSMDMSKERMYQLALRHASKYNKNIDKKTLMVERIRDMNTKETVYWRGRPV